MDIGRTEGVGGPGRVEGPQKLSKVTPPSIPSGSAPADHVDISARAHLTSEALSLPAVRAERVQEVKKLIESGRFETDARLQGALDRFLSENPDAAE